MRKRYLLLAMTILFGLALLAVDNYTQEDNAPLSERQSSEADYYGEILLNRQFDEQGRLQQSFSAQRSTHYPLTNSTVFNGPIIQIQDEEGEYWQVTSQEGSMNDKEHLLRLRHQVEIHPLQSNQKNDVTIKTESLDYFTKKQLAETDLEVTIDSAQSRITAIGMRMDMKRQRMELNAKVNTRYVPE